MKYPELNKLREIKVDSSIEEIIQAFKDIKSFYCNFAIVPEKSYLFRTRLSNKKFVPKDSTELSYNPEKEYVGIGRANPKEYPAFYGCTHPYFSKEEQIVAINLAIKEGSGIFRKSELYNDYEVGCLSRWTLTKPLKCIAFLNHDYGSNANELILKHKDDFKKDIYKNSPSPEKDWEIHRIIAENFAKEFKDDDPNKFRFTSLLAKNYYENGYDGIIFPSVIGNAEGLNIAIKPSAADSLKLEYVAQIVNIKKNGFFNTIYVKQAENIKENKIENWENAK